MKYAVCVPLGADLFEALAKEKGNTFITKNEIMKQALTAYLKHAAPEPNRLYLDVPEDIKGKLREVCVRDGKTLNEVVNAILNDALAV